MRFLLIITSLMITMISMYTHPDSSLPMMGLAAMAMAFLWPEKGARGFMRWWHRKQGKGE